ncbi:fatty acid synthase [Trichonephila clavipes]|nr:fatty acid synthase [Trichonephila clavipes]
MFFDESRFSLQSDSRRTLIWRAPGTRYHQENTIERHRYGGAGWLVWGGIILGSRTDLHVQSVTMTGHIYRDVILEQHVRLFRGAMGAEFLFMDDNTRPYRANIVDECLQSEDIIRMDWPAYSADLNPIEHVWDMLGRRIAARQPSPTCLPELRRALLDEWCNIPQDQIDNLYSACLGVIRSEEPQIKATPSPGRVLAFSDTLFHPERSYVIIGGLGGFGLELCQWMVERGAKHIILTSRSGIRTGYQKLCMNKWKKEGVNITVSTENAGNMNEAKLLLQKAASIKPVGGIFNLALVLRDAFMENQTIRNFEEVCAPKVTATVNLDALSRDLCPQLQWFICFSSVSCGRGNAGQTNYGYANSVMERICEQRTQEGLPGLAIQWGPIGDVGILQDTVGSDIVISGMISQSIHSCLSSLDKFLQQKHPVVLSCIPYLPEKISSSKTSKCSILSVVGKIFEEERGRKQGDDSLQGYRA